MSVPAPLLINAEQHDLRVLVLWCYLAVGDRAITHPLDAAALDHLLETRATS